MGGTDWAEPLDKTNLFFHHLGRLKMEEGSLKIIKTIDLSSITDQIEIARNEVSDLLRSCRNRPCSIGKKKEMGFFNEMLKLKGEIGTVYSLLGNHQRKRSINIIGSGLKYLFGTMDHDDEIEINTVLQNLGDRQDKLHTTMEGTVHLMSNLSKQWESLWI